MSVPTVPKTIRSFAGASIETMVSNVTWLVVTVVDENFMAYLRAAAVPGIMSKWTKTMVIVGRIP
jgi:hypothetical protein